MTATIVRPPLEFQINDMKIKWTYGLQIDIQRMIPDAPQVITLLTTDPYLRDFVVRRALTNSGKSITAEDELIAAEAIDSDPDAILDLLDWISGHLMYFFTKSARSAARLGTEHRDELTRLMPSLIGSEDSASTTPVAGPSE